MLDLPNTDIKKIEIISLIHCT